MKLARTVLIMLFSLILLVACNEDVSPLTPEEELVASEQVEASLSLFEVEEKTLFDTVDTETSYYTYTATPLFTLAQPAEIVGIRSTEYNYGSDGSASLGYFTAGRWAFHVYAYNEAGFLIREGETTVFLKKTLEGISNTVPVTLYRSVSRLGNVYFNITTNNVSPTSAQIGLSWSYNQGDFTAETFKIPTSRADNLSNFEFTQSGLQSGVYTFRVNLYDGDLRLGGTTISTYVLGSDPVATTTEVTGTIYPAEYLLVAFEMEIPDSITGSIGNIRYGEIGVATTFTWEPTTGTPAEYVWYRDGIEITRGIYNTYTWTPDAPGAYTITCVGLSESGLESGSASCLLDVRRGRRNTFTATWESPSGAQSVSYTGAAKASSLVRVQITDGTDPLYTGYLTLTQAGSAWTASIEVSGRTLSFVLSNGTLTMTPSAALTGWTVLVEGSV